MPFQPCKPLVGGRACGWPASAGIAPKNRDADNRAAAESGAVAFPLAGLYLGCHQREPFLHSHNQVGRKAACSRAENAANGPPAADLHRSARRATPRFVRRQKGWGSAWRFMARTRVATHPACIWSIVRTLSRRSHLAGTLMQSRGWCVGKVLICSFR